MKSKRILLPAFLLFFITSVLALSLQNPDFSQYSTSQTSPVKPQDTVKFQLNSPRLYTSDGDGFTIIAHRGASGYYPENTLPAFEAAIEMGAEMVELDVMLSQDGVPVVFHDETLDRCTNGKGRVTSKTVEELKKLDAGSWFARKFAGTKIPTLDEVLELCKGRISVNIEIKSEAVGDSAEGGIEEKCLQLVKKYQMEEHVIFSSFNYKAIRHINLLAPNIPAAILYNGSTSKYKLPSDLIRLYDADAFNCSGRQLTKKWLANVKQWGIPVNVYTINKPGRMRELIKLGADGIFSDKPDLLAKAAAEVAK